MAAQDKPTPRERRARALERMDAGHQALQQSLEGLATEEAFLGSRWSVWEILKHLDSSVFVDSLERFAAGAQDMLPGFDSREAHLNRDLERLEATFQRLRQLFEGLSEVQLGWQATPPNPHNSYPGLSMIDLIERVVGHEGTHAQQINATRKYVAEFSAKERAVTFAGLGPGDSSLVPTRVRELVSQADYVAGAGAALQAAHSWIRGVELELREDNMEEVLSRLGREAISGQWALVVCLGDPAQSCPELIEAARRHCTHVAIRPNGDA